MIEYAVPKESNKAHRIIFNNPIDASKPLVDSANIQKAKRKMAGVSSSDNFMLAFMVMMGSYLGGLDGLQLVGRMLAH